MKLNERGAYNITKNIYQSAICASNEDKYECIDPYCNEPVFLKKGQKKISHFCHYKQSKCKIFNKTRSGISHKDARKFLARFLKKGGKIHVTRKCCGNYSKCYKNIRINNECILLENNKIQEEYAITFKNETRYLNIAQVNSNNEVVEFYEIFESSSKKENQRPSYIKWYHFTTSSINEAIINMIVKNRNYLELNCNRLFRCKECTFANNELIKLKNKLKKEDFTNVCQYAKKYNIKKLIQDKLIDLAKKEGCYIGFKWDRIKRGSLELDIRSCDILDPIKYYAIINYYLPSYKLLNTNVFNNL